MKKWIVYDVPGNGKELGGKNIYAHFFIEESQICQEAYGTLLSSWRQLKKVKFVKKLMDFVK